MGARWLAGADLASSRAAVDLPEWWGPDAKLDPSLRVGLTAREWLELVWAGALAFYSGGMGGGPGHVAAELEKHINEPPVPVRAEWGTTSAARAGQAAMMDLVPASPRPPKRQE